jgi:antitoxin component YwqK of YwqJK toxin-antitoxin module
VDSDYAKFRCDKARVVDIVNFNNGISLDKDSSFYDHNFVYRKGEIVSADYNPQINKVCSTGIHYFKTQDAAINWWYRQKNKYPMDGVYIDWYESGRKCSEQNYNQGQRDGLWTEWYESGQKKFEEDYKQGQKDGLWTEWYESGQKKYEL